MGPTQLVKEKNGHVTRFFKCCGTYLYKKDLTENMYYIRRNYGGKTEDISFKPGKYLEIECPNCKINHKICSI